MPFVRKTDLQGSQPPTDTRKLFIGRTGELLFFVQNILKPEEPTHNILSIWGQGGVGKSTLLARFIDEAHSAEFKDYCLTALVDERQTTPLSIMEKFADQLHMKGEFEKWLKQYKEALRKQQTERETMQDAVLNRVPDFAGAAAEMVPLVGPLLREGAKATAGLYLDKRQKAQGRRDAELLEDPVNELTRAFVNELNQLAESQVLLGSRRVKNLRVILCFDTFEQLATEAAPWLLNYFLPADIKSNIVLVIAGRDPIERSLPEDTKYWLPYCDNEIIYWIPLNSFTEDETRAYLSKRHITDPERVATIWQLSQGLPLYLGLLTSNPLGKVDPTADVVANFLRWIPKEEQTRRQLALDAALFSRPFNQDDLLAFPYLSEHELLSLYSWLIAQPFVRSQEGRYSYHDLARELFSRHLYQRSKKKYYATRRALASFYQELLENMQEEKGKEASHSEEWLELVLAVVSQLLMLPDQASHSKAIEHILPACYHTNKEQQKTIARALRDLSQEPSSHHVSPAARSVATHLLSYIEAEVYFNRQVSQEWLAASDALLEKIIDTSSFSSELVAKVYDSRGLMYMSLGERELAFENFQQALRLLDPMNYVERGWVYFDSQNYQQALAFLNHALERNPRDAGAYFARGWAYLRLEENQLAIADFNHTAELDPNENPEGRDNGLSWAYYRTGQYQQALSVNDHLLEQDPDYSEVYYIFRSRCFLSLKDYPLSIDACNHALELAPMQADAYFQRGLTYLWLKDLGQAQADFTRSCELEPTKIEAVLLAEWVGMCQGTADLPVSERLEAIAPVELQDYTAHICLGIALLLRRNLRGALAELEQALLSPQHVTWSVTVRYEKWEAHFWRGMICAYLEQDDEAIAAIERSLELELPPILLTPLRWFEQDRPDFYQTYVVSLLARYDLVR